MRSSDLYQKRSCKECVTTTTWHIQQNVGREATSTDYFNSRPFVHINVSITPGNIIYSSPIWLDLPHKKTFLLFCSFEDQRYLGSCENLYLERKMSWCNERSVQDVQEKLCFSQFTVTRTFPVGESNKRTPCTVTPIGWPFAERPLANSWRGEDRLQNIENSWKKHKFPEHTVHCDISLFTNIQMRQF